MKAPDFSLIDQNGIVQSLKDYAGRWVVLYFYPKDNTSGCTAEACNFRDEREAIRALGNAEIIGISKDSVASHKRFADKHGLTFPILSDPDHADQAASHSDRQQVRRRPAVRVRTDDRLHHG